MNKTIIAVKQIFCLHTILTLNPGGDMCAPGQGATEGAQHVVPLDPFARGHGTWFAGQNTRLKHRNTAGGQTDQGQHGQQCGWHLGHDRSQYGRRWVFAFPVRFLGLQGRKGRLGEGSHRSRGTDLRGRDEGLSRQGKQSTENKGELRHGIYCLGYLREVREKENRNTKQKEIPLRIPFRREMNHIETNLRLKDYG